jgi:hypothetical protein
MTAADYELRSGQRCTTQIAQLGSDKDAIQKQHPRVEMSIGKLFEKRGCRWLKDDAKEVR